jgi:hypothetical protein
MSVSGQKLSAGSGSTHSICLEWCAWWELDPKPQDAPFFYPVKILSFPGKCRSCDCALRILPHKGIKSNAPQPGNTGRIGLLPLHWDGLPTGSTQSCLSAVPTGEHSPECLSAWLRSGCTSWDPGVCPWGIPLCHQTPWEDPRCLTFSSVYVLEWQHPWKGGCGG